jgi:thymidylate kinase
MPTYKVVRTVTTVKNYMIIAESENEAIYIVQANKPPADFEGDIFDTTVEKVMD